MATSASVSSSTSIYRVDKFSVPSAARDEFLERVDSIHEFLRTLTGFVDDAILEQTGGPGTFNIVTIVIWSSPEAAAAARDVVTRRYAEIGFDPVELMGRLGIEADLAVYAPRAA